MSKDISQLLDRVFTFRKLINSIKSVFILSIFFSFHSSILAQNQSAILRESVKEAREMVRSLEIYDQIESKRLYGAVSRNGAIEFKIQSSPLSDPTSTVVAIATDGSVLEMEIRVYITNALNKPIRQIRKDLVENEREWVFEIIDSAKSYLIDIRILKSKNEVALVEVIHSFFYGHQSDPAFSTSSGNPGIPRHKAPKQDSENLAPIDTQNRFEFFKKALGK
ncbi:hypothetical protein [Leptospira sp. GIMC2001]|uniref:hypothetical protein n=1 Tax=Leptospira sp. GIMC2001 TaxID=1513297 RepID=UPI0023493102|nr:hypothetical protein [Leptospira sp. GIMC2001]WCL50040.1 hypothetical protein O4O04_04255 [Leptospira sp. GIMC2001]